MGGGGGGGAALVLASFSAEKRKSEYVPSDKIILNSRFSCTSRFFFFVFVLSACFYCSV